MKSLITFATVARRLRYLIRNLIHLNYVVTVTLHPPHRLYEQCEKILMDF